MRRLSSRSRISAVGIERITPVVMRLQHVCRHQYLFVPEASAQQAENPVCARCKSF